MKNLLILTILVTFLLQACVEITKNNYSNTITNEIGQVKGYIRSDGAITNRAGQVQGYIRSDGAITNRAGQVQGYIK